jgi:hypothetical protein
MIILALEEYHFSQKMTFRVILLFCKCLRRSEQIHNTHRRYAPFANAAVGGLASVNLMPQDNHC